MNTLNVWLIRINMLVWAVVIVMSIKGCTRLQSSDFNHRKISIDTSSTDDECKATVVFDYNMGSEGDHMEVSHPGK